MDGKWEYGNLKDPLLYPNGSPLPFLALPVK
jgi:hypothetical protein